MQLQKQPSRRVLRERCPENMEQISSRTPILKFKQSNFIEITLQHGCSPVYLLHIFSTLFPKDTSGRLLLQLKSKKVTNLHFLQIKKNCIFLQQIMGIYRHYQTKKLDFLKTFHRCNQVLYKIKKITNFHFASSQNPKQKFLYISRIFRFKNTFICIVFTTN